MSRRLTPSAVLELAAAKKLAARDREIKTLRRQLADNLESLQRLRAARTKVPAAGAVRRRAREDTVRIVVGDIHGMRHDPGAIKAFLTDLRALDPHEIILGGDITDCGGFLAQHHTMGYVAETDYCYEQDIAAANEILNAIHAAAPRARIDAIEGNHERRVETWAVTQALKHAKDAEMLRRAVAPEFMLNLAGRGMRYFRQSECYDGLSIPGVIRRGKCYFTHEITTARHAAAMAQVRTACNLVFFHTHRAQSEITRRLGAGIVGTWNPGCMCALQPLWQHTHPTEWTHGYAVQLVAKSEAFLHLNIPIIEGQSLLTSLFRA